MKNYISFTSIIANVIKFFKYFEGVSILRNIKNFCLKKKATNEQLLKLSINQKYLSKFKN